MTIHTRTRCTTLYALCLPWGWKALSKEAAQVDWDTCDPDINTRKALMYHATPLISKLIFQISVSHDNSKHVFSNQHKYIHFFAFIHTVYQIFWVSMNESRVSLYIICTLVWFYWLNDILNILAAIQLEVAQCAGNSLFLHNRNILWLYDRVYKPNLSFRWVLMTPNYTSGFHPLSEARNSLTPLSPPFVLQ